jgi:co-chaperonin GroES (HSP10)
LGGPGSFVPEVEPWKPTATMLYLETALNATNGAMSREVLVVGDKVLIKPEEENAKTPSGLFLPVGVQEKEAAMGGYVVNVGPGYPTVEPLTDGEPWSGGSRSGMRYVPLQAAKGDFAIFLRSNAVEVEIDASKYLIVPHAAILLLIRDKIPLP